MYWTPDGQDNAAQSIQGRQYLEWLVEQRSDEQLITVIAGDFNARHASWDPRFAATSKSHARGNELCAFAQQRGFRIDQQFTTSRGGAGTGEAAVDLFLVLPPLWQRK